MHEGVMPADMEAPRLGDLALGYQPKLGVGEGMEGQPLTRRSHERSRLSISRRSGHLALVILPLRSTHSCQSSRADATTDDRSRPSLVQPEGAGEGIVMSGGSI